MFGNFVVKSIGVFPVLDRVGTVLRIFTKARSSDDFRLEKNYF